jgi:Calcineurin-like phosphoesterase
MLVEDLGVNEPHNPTLVERGNALDELVRIRATLPTILERARRRVETGELPLLGWGFSLPRIQQISAEDAVGPWFFMGDLHNDFLAWHTLFEHVRRVPGFRLCFLGDLVDRGPHHIECFAAILEAAETYPGQILWILGNHDEGVGFDSRKAKFTSNVIPSEFSDWLNEESGDFPLEAKRPWGRLFIDVCMRLPRAVLFPDGLLATHGGVPLEDRWGMLKSIEALHHPKTLGDFTWTRAAAVPLRRGWKLDPARRLTSSAFDFGYRDLEGFVNAVRDIFPVKRVIRGHDHVEGGAERPEGYETIPVLTLNGFGFDYLSNSVATYRESLALGVQVEGDLPRVEAVPIPPGAHNLVYPALKSD